MKLHVHTFHRVNPTTPFAHTCKPGPLVWLPARLGFAMLLMAGPALAAPLASPSIASTLPVNDNPFALDTELLGKVYVSGQLSGLGIWQNHVVDAPGNGNDTFRADLSNAQVEIQTVEGPLQFYLQAGNYSLPSLGSAYMKSSKASDELYGNLPVGYLKAPIGERFEAFFLRGQAAGEFNVGFTAVWLADFYWTCFYGITWSLARGRLAPAAAASTLLASFQRGAMKG